MGKTISLKLTNQEEMIITSMRNKGISPSTFIRGALWNYLTEYEKKPYKEVNLVKGFFKEKKKDDDRKVYNKVNQKDEKVNQNNDFLQEKMVYPSVNHDNEYHEVFLEQYIYQLQRQIQQIDRELHDWKTRYEKEIQFWKQIYQELQNEYQSHVKDTTKRIDDRFNQIMFYIEELKKSPVQSLEMSSTVSKEIQNEQKPLTAHNARM